MAEEPHWLTAGQISVSVPRPSLADINIAARAIPDIVLKSGTGEEDTHSISTTTLIEKLRSGGFSRDTAEWSVHALIVEEFLRPTIALEEIVPPDGKYDINEIVVVSSKQLWRWWRDQMPGLALAEKRLTTTIVSEYDPAAIAKANIAVLRAEWPGPERNEIYDPQERLDTLWALISRVPNIRLPQFPVISYPSPRELWMNEGKKEVIAQVKQAWRDFHQALGNASVAISEAERLEAPVEQSKRSSKSSEGKVGKRGRPRKDQIKCHNEMQIAADWKRANAAQTPKAVFASDLGMSVDELNRLLDRVRK